MGRKKIKQRKKEEKKAKKERKKKKKEVGLRAAGREAVHEPCR